MFSKTISITLIIMFAASLSALADENLAAGKSYTFSLPPTYPLCTDEGDATDLTDGVVAPGVSDADRDAASSLWGSRSAVGWMHARQMPEVTIDLGEVQPISGVALHTASGASGVSAFRSIPVLVSDDGETYRCVGDLVDLNTQPMPPNYPGYDVYWLKATELQTKGRYVKFVLIAGGVFGFADEIEVYAGEASWLDRPAGGEPMTPDQLRDPVRLTRLGAESRVRHDLQTVAKWVAKGPRGQKRDKRAQQIAGLRDQIADMNLTGLEASGALGFRAIVPFNDLHAEVYAMYGLLLADAGVAPLTLWQSSPNEILPAFMPPRSSVTKIDMAMMGNERRSEVLNLTNASSEPREISFRIEGLSDEEAPPKFVKVYQVEPVDTREGAVVPAALTALQADGDQYQTIVPAGMTRQVWLAFETYGNAVAAGEYEGKVVLTSDLDGGKTFEQQVPITLRVAEIQLPDDDRFDFMTWDYIFGEAYGITEGNRDAARQHVINDPLLNGVWGTGSELPFPEAFDAEGNIVGEIDFTRWDRFVEFWPGMKRYFVFAVWRVGNTPGGLVYGTPRFERGMAQWSAAWAKHNRSLGLKPGQAVILFIDEPVGDDWLKASYDCAKAFKAGTDEILTFTDPHINSPDEHYGKLNAEAYDIVCPHLPAWPAVSQASREAYHAAAKNPNQEMFFYSCSGPNRTFGLDYFRLQPWQAFHNGATGGGFWAYAPTRAADSWNEYVQPWTANYALPYVGPYGVTGSKQWEAAREGVQDYLYLSLLAEYVDNGQGDSKTLEQAKRLLVNDVEKVLEVQSKDDTRSTRADRAENLRRQVLVTLKKIGN